MNQDNPQSCMHPDMVEYPENNRGQPSLPKKD